MSIIIIIIISIHEKKLQICRDLIWRKCAKYTGRTHICFILVIHCTWKRSKLSWGWERRLKDVVSISLEGPNCAKEPRILNDFLELTKKKSKKFRQRWIRNVMPLSLCRKALETTKNLFLLLLLSKEKKWLQAMLSTDHSTYRRLHVFLHFLSFCQLPPGPLNVYLWALQGSPGLHQTEFTSTDLILRPTGVQRQVRQHSMLHGVQHGPHNLCLQGNMKGSSQALSHSGNKRTWKMWDHASKSSWLAQHEDHFTSVYVFPVLCYPRLGNLRILYLILDLPHSTHQSGSHASASFHFLIFNLFQLSVCLFSVLWLFPLVAYSTHKNGFVFSTPSCGWWGMTRDGDVFYCCCQQPDLYFPLSLSRQYHHRSSWFYLKNPSQLNNFRELG